jgi:hypothetical protein
MQHKINNLDKVLVYMASSFAKQRVQFDTILKHLRNEAEWDNEWYYLGKIMDRLVKDGYVELVSRLHGVYDYLITWDGIHFRQSGGYEQNLEGKSRINRIEDSLRRFQLVRSG